MKNEINYILHFHPFNTDDTVTFTLGTALLLSNVAVCYSNTSLVLSKKKKWWIIIFKILRGMKLMLLISLCSLINDVDLFEGVM